MYDSVVLANASDTTRVITVLCGFVEKPGTEEYLVDI